MAEHDLFGHGFASGNGALPRLSTGNPQADHILNGGFPRNSINVIIGQPGTGKTIFAEQLVFHNAGDDRPILYLSTLSEPLAKMVTYLQGFDFFDETKLGSAVIYQDLGIDLVTGGISSLVPRLKEAIKSISPKIIAIDSFRALHDLTDDATTTRRMMYDLGGLLAAYDTTVFLIGEYNDADIGRYPEFAVADGIVEFSRHKLGNRDERFFRVVKLRGSRYLEGAHAFDISRAGLSFFPRLVSPVLPVGYEPIIERVSTGVPGLDALMGGGLWRGSSTLIAGPTGGGKTTLALQFAIAGVQNGEPTLFANFQENPTQLARMIRALGLDPDKLQAGGLELVYASPVELRIDSIIVDMFQRIEKRGIRRIVIDSIGDLALSAADPRRLHDYLYALTQHFAAHGVTSALTQELSELTGSLPAAAGVPIGSIVDNILILQLGGDQRTRRTVRVHKTRGSAQDMQAHELEIDHEGARVRSGFAR
jgi:circadian clock protein KaiC